MDRERESTDHGRWSDPTIPKTGWKISQMFDRGTPDFLCEMCQVMYIRYVHYMLHPTESEGLAVGCICAGHMQGDLQAAWKRERQYVSQQRQRAKLFEEPWRTSRAGNPYKNFKNLNA